MHTLIRLTNLPYSVDAELDEEGCVAIIHSVYPPDVDEYELDAIHEEINRGKFDY